MTSSASVTEFWRDADRLRGSLRAEYFRHVVLGLMFLCVVAPEHQRAGREHCRPCTWAT